MGKRTAILYAGSSYNIRHSLTSQLENLIIPNDADVFVLTTRFCKRRMTYAGEIPLASENEKWNAKNADTIVNEDPLTDDELQLIRDTFGDRLKVLQVVDDMPAYMDYIHMQRHLMMEAINEYIKVSHHLKQPAPYNGIFVNTSDVGTIRCIIDQYNHIKKCYELMEQYENENGFKYEWVIRARIDFIVPEVININHYAQNHDQPYLYVAGSYMRDVMIWSDEFFWFSKRVTAAKLFPQLHRMGFDTSRKYQTLQYGTPYAIEGNDFVFDPECQFGILLKELDLKVINVRIYRSGKYTNGGEYDYFNYFFERAAIDLNYEYELVKNCETDINQHADTLRHYAEKCEHVTEMGIRFGNSTVMFFAARPKKFVSYDVFKEEKVNYLELVAKESNINWELKIMNPSPEDATESQIEPTQLLFIDTNHFAQQLSLELRLHADRVSKYIILHDTETFGTRGAGDDHLSDGLNIAIAQFLQNHSEWIIKEKFTNNNGLTVLERIGNGN